MKYRIKSKDTEGLVLSISGYKLGSPGQVSNGQGEKQDKAWDMEQQGGEEMKGKGATLKEERKGGGEGSRRSLASVCAFWLYEHVF